MPFILDNWYYYPFIYRLDPGFQRIINESYEWLIEVIVHNYYLLTLHINHSCYCRYISYYFTQRHGLRSVLDRLRRRIGYWLCRNR